MAFVLDVFRQGMLNVLDLVSLTMHSGYQTWENVCIDLKVSKKQYVQHCVIDYQV